MELHDSNIIVSTHYTWNQFMAELPDHENKLQVLHVNIRSMIKNHAQLEYIIAQSSSVIHLLILTEVNIADAKSSLFEIKNYGMFMNQFILID